MIDLDRETPESLLRRARDYRWWALRHYLLGEDLEDEARKLERHAAALGATTPLVR